MTRISRCFRAPIVSFGLLLALCGAARCDDPADSSRDSIIQGVRDDVRRHIRDQTIREAGDRTKRAETSQAPTTRRAAKRRK